MPGFACLPLLVLLVLLLLILLPFELACFAERDFARLNLRVFIAVRRLGGAFLKVTLKKLMCSKSIEISEKPCGEILVRFLYTVCEREISVFCVASFTL